MSKRQHDVQDTLAMIPWFWKSWRASSARARVLSTKNYLAGWCYRELLDAHWMTADCALEDDDEQLAALCGVTVEEWLSVRPEVIRWFKTARGGRTGKRLRSARAYFEWKVSIGRRSINREKAERAAKLRWEKEKGGKYADAPSMRQACPPSPSPSPSPDLTDTLPLPLSQARPDGTANGRPPSPPATAGGSDRERPADAVRRIARALKERWSPDAPLPRKNLTLIRTALTSMSTDEILDQIEASEHPPPWLQRTRKI